MRNYTKCDIAQLTVQVYKSILHTVERQMWNYYHRTIVSDTGINQL